MKKEHYLESHLRLKSTRQVIDVILSRNVGNNFVQCGKCGSINLDLRELAIILESFNTEDEIREECNDLFRQIVDIGFPEDCLRNQDCNKWFEKNEYRYSEKLSVKWGDSIFLKPIQDVVLKIDDKCGCFKDCSLGG